MLRHELVDRGHAEEHVDALRRVADQSERKPGIERAHDQHGAAGMQHRVGVAIEPAGVEQRQHGQQHRGRRDIGRPAEIDAVPERHAVGDDGALRLARGARGVHDGRDVIERDELGLVERFCTCDRGLVAAVRSQQQRGCNLAQLCHRQCDLGKLRVMDHQHRRGVADDVVQLGNGEAGIQRQEHRADPPAGELHFQRIGGIEREHGDAVAALDAERPAQMRGEPGNAGIELRVSEASSAGEVDGRHLVRRAAAEMRDPVIVANWQKFPPRSAVLCRLISFNEILRTACPSSLRLASGCFVQHAASNPVRCRMQGLSCVEWLNPGCHTRESGYPVRRVLSIPSPAPLEYWVARSSRAMTAMAAGTTPHSRRSFRARFGRLVPPSP